jgi:hypothetical protein
MNNKHKARVKKQKSSLGRRQSKKGKEAEKDEFYKFLVKLRRCSWESTG